MSLIIENVRSFNQHHTIPIQPLTILIGENSSGKSTLLGSLALTSQTKGNGFPIRPSFNTPPYEWGSYSTIATYRGGKYGRAKSFSIGYSGLSRRSNKKASLIATYKEESGHPAIQKVDMSTHLSDIQIVINNEEILVSSNTPEVGEREQGFKMPSALIEQLGVNFSQFLTYIMTFIRRPDQPFEPLFEFIMDIENISQPTLSIAPVRTKPRRTYDEINDNFRPEGDHVPLLLSRIWGQHSDKRKKRLADAFKKFGTESGLFKDIDVRRLGRHMTDPFQISVKQEGPPVNLSDVGYGVSQALPIIVESILASPGSRLLLQQPEVHLHPRAQAALGTFFCELVTSRQNEFVVETHSDYFLDRIRQEVARKNILAKNVVVLYFEKSNLGSKVFPIHLDDNGNLINTPPEYRAFFLEEELNLLTRVR